MEIWKLLALCAAFFAAGSIRETYNIFTSRERDIAERRSLLAPTALITTGLFIFMTLYFWAQ